MSDHDEDHTAGSSAENRSVGTDGERSVFADLLEKIDERRSNFEPSSITSGARAGEDDAGSVDDEGPLDRVRDLIPEGLPAPPLESDLGYQLGGRSGNRTLYLGIAIGVLSATLIPGVAAFTIGHANDTFFAPPPVDYVSSNDTLYLEADDASYLNRVFEETSHEVAYCGLITYEDQPRLKVWMADTVNASPTQVAFITENCPDATREVLIHTHPNGVLRLSERDTRTLEEQPERFMCIHGGPIPDDPGAEVENLACYRQSESPGNSSELSRIPITITDGHTENT